MLALAGGKAADDIQNSVKRMAEINSGCECHIWKEARHNIPTAFAKRFNKTVCSFFAADS